MSAARIAFLFDRYISGTCTEKEKQELANFVLSSKNEKIVQELLEKAWNDVKEKEVMPKQNASTILNSILQQEAENKEEKEGTYSKKVIRIFPWRRIAVAVSILLIAGLSVYFLVGKRNFQNQQIVKVDSLHHLIAPESNKAILTLADGRDIILDSVQNGLLNQQGNAKIIKLADGRLAYQRGEVGGTEISYNKITTPRGGQFQLTLSDGSRVWLNAASSITFPTLFSGNQREVNITGEAYFEIVHHPKMPFRVKVNNMEVQVLGTRFNVNAFEEEGTIKTTLLEGSVRIIEGTESALIKPGEQTTVFRDGKYDGRITVQVADIGKAIAWKNGLFQFNDDRLENILRQVSRWYNVDVEWAADKKDLRFNGVISRRSNVKAVTDLLSATGVVNFKMEEGKLIAY